MDSPYPLLDENGQPTLPLGPYYDYSVADTAEEPIQRFDSDSVASNTMTMQSGRIDGSIMAVNTVKATSQNRPHSPSQATDASGAGQGVRRGGTSDDGFVESGIVPDLSRSSDSRAERRNPTEAPSDAIHHTTVLVWSDEEEQRPTFQRKPRKHWDTVKLHIGGVEEVCAVRANICSYRNGKSSFKLHFRKNKRLGEKSEWLMRWVRVASRTLPTHLQDAVVANEAFLALTEELSLSASDKTVLLKAMDEFCGKVWSQWLQQGSNARAIR
jgi:hypothetical protein